MQKAHSQNTHLHACTITDGGFNDTLIDRLHALFDTDTAIVIGVDEVGRGSLFGQMTVAATILPVDLTGEFDKLDLTNTPLQALNDSKKLSAKKRESLNTAIKALCHAHVIVDVPAHVIDEIDIYQATLLGMRLAIEMLIKKLNIRHSITPNQLIVLIDGNATPILSPDFAVYQSCLHTLVKGDGIHSSIACASILAKVHRDTAMMQYATRYPDYAIDKHKGYASSHHRHAIHTLGILPEHRKSFNPMKTMLRQQTLFDSE